MYAETMGEVAECRMRRNNPIIFVTSSSSLSSNNFNSANVGVGMMTSSSSTTTDLPAAATPNHPQCSTVVMDDACPITVSRSKTSSIILLLAISAAIFPTFYAVGMLLGTAIGAYTQWDGDISSISMPSTIALRKQALSNELVIDTVGMSSNELALLKKLSASSFLRGRILDIMVKEYISPTTLDNDNESKRESAIEAWQFTEMDNEPVPIAKHPFLFVGSVAASMNHQSLKENGITHIINWSSSAKCHSFPDIQYLCYGDIRSPNEMENHVDKLDEAVEYIALARASGGKVMSHCWYGRNRSVTLLVAYLMKYEKLSSDEALHVVQNTRPKAAPYQNVLDAYRERYLMG